MPPRSEIAQSSFLPKRISPGRFGLICGTAAVLAVFGWRFLPLSFEQFLGYFLVLLSCIWAYVSFLAYQTFRSYQVGFGISLALFTVALLLYQSPGNGFLVELAAQTAIMYPLALLILQNILGPPEHEGRFPFPRWLLRFDPVLRRAETNRVFEAFGRVRRSRKRWKYSPQVVVFVCLFVVLILLGPLLDTPFAGPANMTGFLVVLVAVWISWKIFGRIQSTRSHPPNRMPHALTDLLNPKKGHWTHQALDLWMTGCGGREVGEALYLEYRLRNFRNPWAWGVYGFANWLIICFMSMKSAAGIAFVLALLMGVALYFVALFQGIRNARKKVANLRLRWRLDPVTGFSKRPLPVARYDVFLALALVFVTASTVAALFGIRAFGQGYYTGEEKTGFLVFVVLTGSIGFGLGVWSLGNFRRLWRTGARENLRRFRSFRGAYRGIMEAVARRTEST